MVALAQPLAQIDRLPDTQSLALRGFATYYDEGEASLSAAQAWASPQLFRPAAERAHRPDAAMRWLRLDLHNRAAVQQNWVLDLGVPDAEHLEVFVIQGAAPQSLLRLDFAAPYSARPLATRMLGVPLQLAADERQSVLIRYRTHGDTPLSLALMSPARFLQAQADGNLLNGLVFGLLTALCVFALLQYATAGERAFLAYAFMSLMMMAFMAQFEGYNFAWLWPQQGVWNQYAPAVFLVLIQAAQALFAMALFDMRRRYPRLFAAYLIYLLALPLALVVYLLFRVNWFAPLFGAAYLVLVLWTSVFLLRQRAPLAGPFFAGAMLNAFFTNILFALSIFGWLPDTQPFVFPKIGYLCEALCFAVALARQLQNLRTQLEDGLRRHLAEAEQLARVEGEKLRVLLETQQRQLQLASAGHDLSQPLASIRLALSSLRAGNEATAQHIDKALDYTETLLGSLIDDARRSHAESPTRVQLDDLLFELQQHYQAAAQAKGLRLHCRPCARELETSVLLLRRILDNLLSNAIRYTARGRILIGVRYRRQGVLIEVRDTGPGIAAGERERLLAPFVRGDRSAPGQGLGLHIVRTLCEQAGYRLAIHSLPGKGSCFSVLIPVASA
ncbi:hypothetical protein GCM10028811_04590 [Uliginosibacterium sediminicola]